uniref:Reverse transcriptase domain-containing protein n=1 Tax=Chenopodium quinoa TaxID=63459 RepID=A0A803M0P5_CHEQI
NAGHALMSFMDAYSGFHQIPLWEEDQEKTAFVTEQGLYCYKVMPYGLSGKFLRFLIDQRGIEANPEKIQAVMDMKSPRKIKEVQRLTGCLAVLGRFLSRSGD